MQWDAQSSPHVEALCVDDLNEDEKRKRAHRTTSGSDAARRTAPDEDTHMQQPWQAQTLQQQQQQQHQPHVAIARGPSAGGWSMPGSHKRGFRDDGEPASKRVLNDDRQCRPAAMVHAESSTSCSSSSGSSSCGDGESSTSPIEAHAPYIAPAFAAPVPDLTSAWARAHEASSPPPVPLPGFKRYGRRGSLSSSQQQQKQQLQQQQRRPSHGQPQEYDDEFDATYDPERGGGGGTHHKRHGSVLKSSKNYVQLLPVRYGWCKLALYTVLGGAFLFLLAHYIMEMPAFVERFGGGDPHAHPHQHNADGTIIFAATDAATPAAAADTVPLHAVSVDELPQIALSEPTQVELAVPTILATRAATVAAPTPAAAQAPAPVASEVLAPAAAKQESPIKPALRENTTPELDGSKLVEASISTPVPVMAAPVAVPAPAPVPVPAPAAAPVVAAAPVTAPKEEVPVVSAAASAAPVAPVSAAPTPAPVAPTPKQLKEDSKATKQSDEKKPEQNKPKKDESALKSKESAPALSDAELTALRAAAAAAVAPLSAESLRAPWTPQPQQGQFILGDDVVVVVATKSNRHALLASAQKTWGRHVKNLFIYSNAADTEHGLTTRVLSNPHSEWKALDSRYHSWRVAPLLRDLAATTKPWAKFYILLDDVTFPLLDQIRNKLDAYRSAHGGHFPMMAAGPLSQLNFYKSYWPQQQSKAYHRFKDGKLQTAPAWLFGFSSAFLDYLGESLMVADACPTLFGDDVALAGLLACAGGLPKDDQRFVFDFWTVDKKKPAAITDAAKVEQWRAADAYHGVDSTAFLDQCYESYYPKALAAKMAEQ